MTQVYAQTNGDKHRLVLDGHATGDEKVCAAVSSIAYALAGYLTNAAQDGYAQIQTLELESGKAKIQCSGDSRVGAAYDMAIVGLMQLEQQYPELVQVHFLADKKF